MEEEFTIIHMDELNVANLPQQDNISGDSNDNQGIGDMYDDDDDDDQASETSQEETVSLVYGTSANWQHLVFWISFLCLSFLAICLYSTGYFVPGTILLSCAAMMGLGVLVMFVYGICIWKLRKQMYYQRRQSILNWLISFGHNF